MSNSAVRVMVITPHPDDAEGGCGGTVAKWLAEGREVVCVACTSGDKGTHDLKMTPERLASLREEEQLKAAGILGVKDVIFLRHPDGGLEDTSVFREELVRLIKQYRPDIVMTTDPYRQSFQHRDHRITGTVVIDAAFPYARDHLFYPHHLVEGLLPHRVGEIYLWGTDSPDTVIDITDTFDVKLAALRCHVSQIGPFIGSGLEERMRQRAADAGQSQGIALAEAFRRIEFRR